MLVNAICAILQLTLVTHGHLLTVRLSATKGTYIPIVTHNILIINVFVRKCAPYMCRRVFPWTVPYLSSNQKLLQMQEYMHVPMQLNTGSPPYILCGAPMPHACKQVLNMPYRPSCCIACALRAIAGELTQDHLPPVSSKAHKMTTELPSNCCSNAPMNKPPSLVRCNYAVACKMYTCSSGKCHTQVYH